MKSSAFRKELRLIFWFSVAIGSSACGVDNRDLSAGSDAGRDTGATTAAGSGGKAGASGSGSGTSGASSSGMGTGGTRGTGGGEAGGGTPDGGGCRNGDTRCSATGVPQTCNAQGTGFDDQAPCQGDMVCDDATGLCASRCMAGARRCKPGASVIQQCDLLGDWQDTATCPFACGGTGDATMCTGSCVPGTRTCGANNIPSLCDATGTSQMQAACSSACTGAGECTGMCSPNATRCAAGSTTRVETCSATGSWGASTACTFVCDATTNDCGGECTPGAADRCSGSTVQSCDATGHWKDMTNCGTTPCSMGQCRACTPNQKQCNAGKPQTCTAAGNWMDDQATACPYVCDAGTGRCAGECVPGSDACTGNTTKHCGANGLYGAATTCANICDMATGRCGGVCPPGAHQCSGSTAQTCGSNGQWGSNMACQYGCAAATGLCNACTDEAMTTTCGGGKCGPTINNCAHIVQCSTSCPGMGASCGGGGVNGVCGCTKESDAQFCSRLGKVCGAFTGTDNCGTARTVSSCGSCNATQACVTNVCAPRFEGLGPPGEPSYAVGVSADGLTVAGTSYNLNEQYFAFVWTKAGGTQTLQTVVPARQSSVEPRGISANGSVIVGTFDTSPVRPFRWTAAGKAVETSLLSGGSSAYGSATNSDGSVVVGISSKNGVAFTYYPFRWVNGSISEIPAFADGQPGSATGVSNDGTVVVGTSTTAGGVSNAYRWTVGAARPTNLGALGSDTQSGARAVSGNGAVVVGTSGSSPIRTWRWTSSSLLLTPITDSTGWTTVVPYATNTDGTVVVGYSTSGAWIWDTTNGARLLSTVLSGLGINISGWSLRTAYGVSADGKVIVGSGDSPSGIDSAWIARLP